MSFNLSNKVNNLTTLITSTIPSSGVVVATNLTATTGAITNLSSTAISSGTLTCGNINGLLTYNLNPATGMSVPLSGTTVSIVLATPNANNYIVGQIVFVQGNSNGVFNNINYTITAILSSYILQCNNPTSIPSFEVGGGGTVTGGIITTRDLTATNLNGKLNVVGGASNSGNVIFCNNTTSTTGNFDLLTDSSQHFRFVGGSGAGSNVLTIGGATNGAITIPSTNGLITVPTIKNGTSDFTIGNAQNTAGGFVNVGLMNHGTIPYPNVGFNSNNLSIGWNKSSGDAEVDFYNSANSGFNFYGRNTSTSIYQIARLRGDNITTYALSFGSDAYAYLGAGSYGTSIGVRVGNASMSGGSNTLIGYNTGFTLTNGYSNTFVGLAAGKFTTTGFINTFVGEVAGVNNTTGYGNTAIGAGAMAINTLTGNDNTGLGVNALNAVSTGFFNTCVGKGAGQVITGGAGNVCVGHQSGVNITTAYNSVCVGNGAGAGLTTGGSGVYVGLNSTASGGTVNNETVIGTGTGKGGNSCFVTTGNNYQGNNSQFWSQVSDARIKTNIVPLESSLSKILALEPVSYEHKEDIHNNIIKKRTGYIAQDYEKIFPEHCGTCAPSKYEREELGLEEVKNLCPDYMTHLVKAFQEQHAIITDQQKQIDELKLLVNQLLNK